MPRTTPENGALRTLLIAFALWTIAVLTCMRYIDRPVAEFVDAHFRPMAFFEPTKSAIGSLLSVLVVMLGFLFAVGCWRLTGRSLAPWTKTPLLCSWSVAWSLSTAIVLKHVVGRSWPDPSFVQRRVYEFRFLHGGPSFESFPAATTTVAAALLAVLSIRAPRWRPACIVALFLIATALVVTNGHWVADVVGGGFLGVMIGVMTVRYLVD